MLMILLLQIPPTPTPLPPGTAHFSVPENYSLWHSTDAAIHFWNWLGDARYIAQVFLILVLLFIGIVVINRFEHEFTQKDAQD